jgi:hypothetical protein
VRTDCFEIARKSERCVPLLYPGPLYCKMGAHAGGEVRWGGRGGAGVVGGAGGLGAVVGGGGGMCGLGEQARELWWVGGWEADVRGRGQIFGGVGGERV